MKNLWDRDRSSLFNEITKEYLNEGYTRKESRRLARQETEEIMTDRLNPVEDVVKKTYADT